jgi:ATP-dependent DNA ligase
VISRLHSNNAVKIERAVVSNPAYCYLFDCIYLDGRSLINEPVERRREWCKDSIRKGTNYRMSEAIDDGQALWEAAGKMQLEGIIAKRRGSKYQLGKRTTDWIKIKHRQTEEVVILGFTEGAGDRVHTFGALHIAERQNGKLIYRGKVGTGFDSSKMKEIRKILDEVEPGPKLIKEKTLDDKVTHWLTPKVTCEVEFASITPNGTYREPIFQFLVEY